MASDDVGGSLYLLGGWQQLNSIAALKKITHILLGRYYDCNPTIYRDVAFLLYPKNHCQPAQQVTDTVHFTRKGDLQSGHPQVADVP